MGALLLAGCASPPDGGDAVERPVAEIDSGIGFEPPAGSDPQTEPGAAPALPEPAGGSSTVGGPPAGEPVADLSGDWTAGTVSVEKEVTGSALLTEVRTGQNAGFDRVVFTFAGGELPGYHIEYVDRPYHQCGSGNEIRMGGDGWLLVRFIPADAHDQQGRVTIQDRQRAPNLPVLRELRLVCDFEAHVEWLLAVASPNRYRVLELREPTRLVVDVRHRN